MSACGMTSVLPAIAEFSSSTRWECDHLHSCSKDPAIAYCCGMPLFSGNDSYPRSTESPRNTNCEAQRPEVLSCDRSICLAQSLQLRRFKPHQLVFLNTVPVVSLFLQNLRAKTFLSLKCCCGLHRNAGIYKWVCLRKRPSPFIPNALFCSTAELCSSLQDSEQIYAGGDSTCLQQYIFQCPEYWSLCNRLNLGQTGNLRRPPN